MKRFNRETGDIDAEMASMKKWSKVFQWAGVVLIALAAVGSGWVVLRPKPSVRPYLTREFAASVVPPWVTVLDEPRCMMAGSCRDLDGGEPNGTWTARAFDQSEGQGFLLFIVCDDVPDQHHCGWGAHREVP